jgi:hypothetical protein
MANLGGAASGAASGAAAGAAFGPWGAAIGGVVGGVAGLLSGGGDDEQKEALQAAINELNRTGNAPDLSDPVVLKTFQQAGLLQPEIIEKMPLNADQKNELIEAGSGKKNQDYALNALKDMSKTGLTATDRAAFNQMRRQVASDTTAKTNQILQEQQMRGQASGGNTLAAQLSAIQGGNQNASQEADRLAANATQARTSALNSFSNLSGQMRDTDLGVQKYNNDNELARQRFLDQNSLARQTANVNAQNQANQFNLTRQQSTADKNTAQQNAETYRQNEAVRQNWLDNLDKAKAVSAAYTGQAKAAGEMARANAQNSSNTMSGIISGIKDLGTLYGGKGGGTSSGGFSPAAGGYDSSGSGMLTGNSLKFSDGGVVPGEAPAEGDSPENDIVPAALSPGEIVIPRSFAHDPDLSKAYINFIHKNKDKK